MKYQWLSFLIYSVALRTHGQDAILVVVPDDSASQDANSQSPVPFIARSVRYQQAYDASQFQAISGSDLNWITGIYFRADATTGFGVDLPSVQVNLSTTQRGPDTLSTVFADNVGLDDITVFGPGRLQTSAVGGNPAPFVFLLDLSTPFVYDPQAGNLLLDIRIFQGNTNLFLNPLLDGWDRTNDSVSRVYWGGVNASTGAVDSFGLATLFVLQPVPMLRILQESNSVVIAWPIQPNVFVLQSTAELGPQSNWQQVTNETVEFPPSRRLTLPRDSIGATKFFRLIWESGQPIQPATAPALPRKAHESSPTR